jgi:hypothetical protein
VCIETCIFGLSVLGGTVDSLASAAIHFSRDSGLGHQSVIPANAGIQAAMDSRLRGNDGDGFVTKAGTTERQTKFVSRQTAFVAPACCPALNG